MSKIFQNVHMYDFFNLKIDGLKKYWNLLGILSKQFKLTHNI